MFDEQSGGLPATNKDDMLCWLLDSSAFKSSEGGGDEFQTVSRWQLQPACHSQQTARMQMAEVEVQSFNGIEIVFTERLHPSAAALSESSRAGG